MVELLCALLALSLYSVYGLTFRFFFLYYFVVCLVAIAFIDMDLMVIPDILNLPTMFLGLVLSVISPTTLLTGYYLWDKWSLRGWPPYIMSLFGAVMGGLLGFFSLFLLSFIYLKWRKRRGMGDGDPLLMATIGVYLGWKAVFPVLLLATTIALIVVVFLVLTMKFPKVKSNDSDLPPIPFGPFLSLAAILWLFYGEGLTQWYLELMGLTG
jgi:leader peptidase (prepilin peptidase)/N-methyltransferase